MIGRSHGNQERHSGPGAVLHTTKSIGITHVASAIVRAKCHSALKALLLLGPLACTSSASAQPLEFHNALMPEPSSLSVQPGSFQIDTSMTVGFTGAHDDVLEQAAARAITQLEDITGVELSESFANAVGRSNIRNQSRSLLLNRCSRSTKTSHTLSSFVPDTLA